MSSLTKLADLGDRDAITELRERIEQLESQDGPGYATCLDFYKRINDAVLVREETAFRAGWRRAYTLVSWGHNSFTKHEATQGWYWWNKLDVNGNKE